jgi:DUF917 family protein
LTEEWDITEADLAHIALGAGILGTGGGGNTYIGFLRAREALRRGQRIRVIPPERLGADDIAIAVGGIGAPTVSAERIKQGGESLRALRAVEAAAGRPAAAVLSDEIGGSNAMEPMIAAALAGLPVVDADAMGRAFPELQMSTFLMRGLPCAPSALADDKGNVMVFPHAASAMWLERIARAATVAVGCAAAFAMAPVTGADILRHGVRNTVSQAWRLGAAVTVARRQRRDPVAAILAQEQGLLLYEGRIIDVLRRTTAGFARGHMRARGTGAHHGTTLEIEFQNENLIARVDGRPVAIVPDLICILDAATARPYFTDELRFGLPIAVVALPCSPLLRDAAALRVVGPRAFGYDLDYAPLCDYAVPRWASAAERMRAAA